MVRRPVAAQLSASRLMPLASVAALSTAELPPTPRFGVDLWMLSPTQPMRPQCQSLNLASSIATRRDETILGQRSARVNPSGPGMTTRSPWRLTKSLASSAVYRGMLPRRHVSGRRSWANQYILLPSPAAMDRQHRPRLYEVLTSPPLTLGQSRPSLMPNRQLYSAIMPALSVNVQIGVSRRLTVLIRLNEIGVVRRGKFPHLGPDLAKHAISAHKEISPERRAVSADGCDAMGIVLDIDELLVDEDPTRVLEVVVQHLQQVLALAPGSMISCSGQGSVVGFTQDGVSLSITSCEPE